ncbi:MAG: NAD-glutamate dehydrogenase [Anaerolineaceae bacterium]|nr:NAD-glutamate dehydrogenase [Anaerolineaceae bacterium]
MIILYIVLISVFLVVLYDLIQEAKHPPLPMSDEEREFLRWMVDEELMEEELGNNYD